MDASYSDIIEKMRWAGRLKNDSAVAKALGVTPQAISNYKKRRTMPLGLVLKFSNIYGLSMDWLIFGKGEMIRNDCGSFKEKNTAPVKSSEAAVLKDNFVEAFIAALTPEEIIYIGKLLKTMRGDDEIAIKSLKFMMDKEIE